MINQCLEAAVSPAFVAGQKTNKSAKGRIRVNSLRCFLPRRSDSRCCGGRFCRSSDPRSASKIRGGKRHHPVRRRLSHVTESNSHKLNFVQATRFERSFRVLQGP